MNKKICSLVFFGFIIFPINVFAVQNYSNDGGKGKSIAFYDAKISNSAKSVKNNSSDLLRANLTSVWIEYSAIEVIANDKLDEIIKEQKKSESLKYSEASIIKAGELISAQYILYPLITINADFSYNVSCRVIQVKTGKVISSTPDTNYANEADFISYAANDIALSVLPDLGVTLTSYAKSNLSYRENQPDESVEEAQQHYSQLSASLDDINKRLDELNKNGLEEATAISKRASLEAEKQQIELQQEQAQNRLERLKKDQENLIQDKQNEKNRSAEMNKKISQNSIKYDKLADKLRAEHSGQLSVNGKITVLEQKKNVLNNLVISIAKKVKSYNEQEDKDLSDKLDSIQSKPYNSIELKANGKPLSSAKKERKEQMSSEILESETRKKNYEQMLKDNSKTADESIRQDISNSIIDLAQTQKEDSLLNTNLLRFGNYDGQKEAWIAVMNLTVAGENVSSEKITIPYKAVTGADPDISSDTKKKEYNNTVEEYNAYFKRNIPVIYAEIEYTVKSANKSSQYKISVDKYIFYKIDSEKSIYEKNASVSPTNLKIIPAIEIDTDKSLAQYNFSTYYGKSKKITVKNAVSGKEQTSSTASVLSTAKKEIGPSLLVSADQIGLGVHGAYLFPVSIFNIGPESDFYAMRFNTGSSSSSSSVSDNSVPGVLFKAGALITKSYPVPVYNFVFFWSGSGGIMAASHDDKFGVYAQGEAGAIFNDNYKIGAVFSFNSRTTFDFIIRAVYIF